MHTANALLSPVCAQVHILRDQKDVAQDKHEDAIDFVNEDGDVYDIVNVEKSLSGEKSFGGEKSMGRNQWGFPLPANATPGGFLPGSSFYNKRRLF